MTLISLAGSALILRIFAGRGSLLDAIRDVVHLAADVFGGVMAGGIGNLRRVDGW